MENVELFEEDDDGNIVCKLCGSKDVAIIPKWFTTYYVCRKCGNEDRT